MSEEKCPIENEEKCTKAKGKLGWIKQIVSAIIGALLSFCVTFGIITTEQEKEINETMLGINNKAELIVENLKNGNIAEATQLANQIVKDSQQIKQNVVEAKDNVEEKISKIKETTVQSKEKISDAIENK